MIINSIPLAQISSAVWGAATRNLSTEANTKTAIGATNTPVAAGAILDLRPAAGVFREVTLNDGLQASMHNIYYDGTTVVDTSTSAVQAGHPNTNAHGMCIKNSSAGSLNTNYFGYDQT